MKKVKSTDPVKKVLLKFLKEASGANKVTNVTDNEDGTFSGHCMKGNRSGYNSLGTFTVTTMRLFLWKISYDK